LHVEWEKVEGDLAAALAARISFRAAVDAHASNASGLVELVRALSSVVEDVVLGNAKVARFLDASNCLSTTANVSLLVAAALATSSATSKGTVELQKRRIRVELLDVHLEWVAGFAAHATEAIRVFERMSDLLISNKVLELGLGFTSHAFLQASTFGLANIHYSGAR